MKKITNGIPGAFCLRLLLLAVCFAIAGVPLLAQTFYGSILGAVTDSTGASVPGASVTLANIGTSERRTAQTDNLGDYRFVNLLPGSYRLMVEKEGFKRWTRETVRVEVEAAVRIDAPLELGNIAETVVVTAQTPLLQTESTTLGQLVESRKVLEMPLNGRNVYDLVRLVPGVAVSMTGTISIGGGIQGQTVTYMDGAPMNTGYINETAAAVSQDAVQEFRVQTNSASAEFGRTNGGVVNLTTRQGTNELHGSVYEFLRNRVLNASDFFSNASGLKRPPFTRNQFGGTAGGPIVKDKMFFFGSYEGYAQRQGSTYGLTTPLDSWPGGDFSNLKNAQGSPIAIYDPLTVCNNYHNASCAADSKGSPIFARLPFSGNVIPTSRLDPTSQALIKRIWGEPNQPGAQYTYANNYVANASSGSNKDQINARLDDSLGQRQRIFGRFTWTKNRPLPVYPYGRDKIATGTSHDTVGAQGVFGDTYTISPSLVADIRLSYIHTEANTYPPDWPLDLTSIGWPASLNSQVVQRALPMPGVAGFDGLSIASGGPANIIFVRNHVYEIIPSLTKMTSRHTIKLGGEMRIMQFNSLQASYGSGIYAFDSAFTAATPFTTSGSGYSFASFVLGNGSGGTLTQNAATAGELKYDGYYVTHTFQASRRLTINAGLRWELLEPWTERYDRLNVILPNAPSALAQVTGLPLKGKLAYVNSSDRASRYNQDFYKHLLGPRVGLAYRVTDKFVVRTGYGLTYAPNDVVYISSPWGQPVNAAKTSWEPSLDGGITPFATFSNPFPRGLTQLPTRSNFDSTFYGQAVSAPLPTNPRAYSQQWNFSLQRQLTESLMVETAYAGSRGVHLPTYAEELNQLTTAQMALGTGLNQMVANPFYGQVKIGVLAEPTVTRGQLLRPYPQYSSFLSQAAGDRNSSYHSFQAKLDARLRSGGTLLAAYTFSKFITDTENMSSWSEASSSGSAFNTQNHNDLKGERSLSQADAPHRLVVSYVLDLPLGKGKALLGGLSGPADKIVSGWGVNGIGTFQSGYPLYLSMATDQSGSYNGSVYYGIWRPSSTGISGSLSGPAQTRLSQWFNRSAYVAPAAYTFGNLARTLPDVRSAGLNNWDVSLFKNTKVTERASLQFRAEVFNLANRAQFNIPGMSFGTSSFGVVSSQRNSPRLIQLALRLSF